MPSDTDYMKAVEVGDLDAAQNMVDEAAKKAGYDLSHRRRVGEDVRSTGNVVLFVDRDGKERNRSYGDAETVAKSSDYDYPSSGVVEFAREYFQTDNVDSLLDPENIVSDAGAWDDAQFVSDLWQQMEAGRIPESVGFQTSDGAVVLDPVSANFKSADPVTRDDAGNVIPLSERFNKASDDIRYMPFDKLRQLPNDKQSPAAAVLEELRSTNFIPNKVAVDLLERFPEYLVPVSEFILEQRKKLVSGTLSMRDLMKAYLITVSSQGAGAVGVKKLQAKVAKLGIDFSPEELFTDVSSAGEVNIRPEEAAAWWMGTDAGQRALNNAEAGKINPADWQELVEIRRAFGDDRFKTFNVFSEKNIPRITNALDLLNSSKGQSKKMLAAVTTLNGVKDGKKGFISHLLGLGDTPTIDAVEVNFWLTGQGDTRHLKTKKADLTRRLKESLSDARVSEELFRRIDQRIKGLRKKLPGGMEIPEETFAHVIHHWLWDKAKGLETTHAGMYESMVRHMPASEITGANDSNNRLNDSRRRRDLIAPYVNVSPGVTAAKAYMDAERGIRSR